jgi:hypothetical protein
MIEFPSSSGAAIRFSKPEANLFMEADVYANSAISCHSMTALDKTHLVLIFLLA